MEQFSKLIFYFLSIDLARRMKIVIPTLKNCLVIYERFKRHILCFEFYTVEKYDVLERGFLKRLETKASFVRGRLVSQKEMKKSRSRKK